MPTPKILRTLPAGPWAMHPGRLEELARAVARLDSSGADVVPADHPPRLETVRAVGPGGSQPGPEITIGVLPIVGVIAQRAGDWYGDTWTDVLARRFDELVGSDKVQGIVLDTDSPGGIVYGVDELSKRIYDARGSKPIVAQVNSFMASAAYYIGSAADKIAITPTGEAGSIGVLAVHVDFSKALEEAGIAVTFIHAGRFKVEGNAYQPLEQEARDEIQRAVDAYYGMFVAAVARNRGTTARQVKTDLGEGRVMQARQAVEAGMVDRIATLDETIQSMAAAIAKRQAARKAAASRAATVRRAQIG